MVFVLFIINFSLGLMQYYSIFCLFNWDKFAGGFLKMVYYILIAT